MIAWCRDCNENSMQIVGPWDYVCSICDKWEIPYYAFSLPEEAVEQVADVAGWAAKKIYAAMERDFWKEVQRLSRQEFNTVDLKQLREERWRRRSSFVDLDTASFLIRMGLVVGREQ